MWLSSSRSWVTARYFTLENYWLSHRFKGWGSAALSSLSLLISLQLKETENASSVKTLELFAYGTYQDYLQEQGSFLELPDNQLNKLKQLSLVSLGSSQNVFPLSFCHLFLSYLSDTFLFTTAGGFGYS